jgi:hypothetical protein
MIDIYRYRMRIGCYNKSSNTNRRKYKSGGCHFNVEYLGHGYNLPCLKIIFLFYILFILYLSVFIMSVVINHTVVTHHGLKGPLPSSIQLTFSYCGLPSVALVHIRIAYFIFMSYLLNRFIRGQGPLFRNENNTLTPSKIFFPSLSTNRLQQAVASVLIFIALLNFLMIAIVNTSLLNPGPENLKVYYQNVQGLIPFSGLGSAQT